MKIPEGSYLTFKIGKERFASNVSHVRSIIKVPKITNIPYRHDFIIGVISIEENAIPLIDARLKFNIETTEISQQTSVLVLELNLDDEMKTIGILVDSVDEVIELNSELIKPTPRIGAKLKTDIIKGMVQKDDGFIMILNMDKVFLNEEILVVNELSQNVEA